jgi:hypothetical protein
MHLDEPTRLEIRRLYAEGGTSYRKLADRYQVSYQTIYRIINKKNKKTSNLKKSKSVKKKDMESIIGDPLEFRKLKLLEIQMDIVTMRLKGSAHALPPLHRLHVNLYDEYITMKTESEENQSTDPEEILYTIAHAVKNLPPYLKDRLAAMLDDNVIELVQ